MSFAQFLTLLLAACLVLVQPVASLIGLAFAIGEITQISAALFGIGVVLWRRGVAQWLPVVGWLALGAVLANLVLPALGLDPAFQVEAPGLGWVEIGWRLVFLLLLLRGQGGWGDGALLALCIATSHAGSLALLLSLPFEAHGAGDAWQVQASETVAVLGTVLAGLLALLVAGLGLVWVAGASPLRRFPVLAWLGVLGCLMQGVRLLRPWLAIP
jgi:hypothetical protein